MNIFDRHFSFHSSSPFSFFKDRASSKRSFIQSAGPQNKRFAGQNSGLVSHPSVQPTGSTRRGPTAVPPVQLGRTAQAVQQGRTAQAVQQERTAQAVQQGRTVELVQSGRTTQHYLQEGVSQDFYPPTQINTVLQGKRKMMLNTVGGRWADLGCFQAG